MKKLFAFIVFITCLLSQAQEVHVWVYFKDKPNVESALDNPLSILTQKALDRKVRHNIEIDQRDVPVHQDYVLQIKNSAGITYKAQSKWFNCVHITGLPERIDALKSFSFVSHLEAINPSKSSSSKKWIKESTLSKNKINYGQSRNQIEMLNLDELHDAGFTGNGVTIAVTDSGFPNVDTSPGFSSLRNHNKILGGHDFVDRNGIFYDDHYHGSAVLSVMAGSVPGNYEGAAPDASYYLFRTEEAAQETPAELSYWVAAAERADSLGVDIINVSLGYLGFDNSSESFNYQDMDGTTTFISRGANIAFEKGMIVITSAGNSGNSASHPYIAAPADAQGTLAIGSVNASRQKSSFSSVGPTADGRIAPDVAAQGSATILLNTNGSVVSSNGTSFSAPLITAATACLIQAFPDQTPAQIYNAIRASGDSAINPNNQLGYGIPDYAKVVSLLSNESVAHEGWNPYVKNGYLIFAPGEKVTSYRILSISGQQLCSGFSNFDRVDIAGLSSGIYLLQVDNTLKTYKILVP